MTKHITTVLMLLLLFAACRNYYVPRAHYVPVFTEKGDVSLNAGIFHQQAGYAITNNLGLFVTNHFQFQGEILEDATSCGFERKIKGNGRSLGLVAFFKMDEFINFEMPLVYGWGYVGGSAYQRCGGDYYSSFKSTHNFLSLQPSFTYKLDESQDFSVFKRYGFYRSSVLQSTLSPGEHYRSGFHFDEIMNSKDFLNDFYIDAGIQYRVGYKNLKYYIQASSMLLGISEHELSQIMTIRFGLSLNFNTKKVYQSLNKD